MILKIGVHLPLTLLIAIEVLIQMLTFNVMVNGQSVRQVKANSKQNAQAKIERWITKCAGSQSVKFKLQAHKISSPSTSIIRKRNARNGECVSVHVS